MSLPVSQQRVLDGIAETLRLSEPRLASMFAIFTRLTKNEPRPGREQLAAVGRLAWLSALWSRMPGRRTEQGRRAWRLTLIAPLAIASIVVVVLLGLSTHAAANCRGGPASGTAAAAQRQGCSAQAGPYPDSLGK